MSCVFKLNEVFLIMKKFVGLFFILLAIQSVQGMDNDLVNYTDEQCMRVARYIKWGTLDKNNKKLKDEFLPSNRPSAQKVKQFLSTIDEDAGCAVHLVSNISHMSLENLHLQTQHYRDSVRLLANELSRSNMFVFVTFNQDILTAMYQKCLPASYEDRAGFFSEESNSKARVVNSENPPVYPVLSRKDMLKKMQTFPLDKALYVFSFVDMPQSQLSKIRYERELINDSSLKSSTQTKIIPPMDYQWTYEDCKNLAAQQRAYLDAAERGSNNTDWENDMRLVITDGIMRTLNPQTDKKEINPVQDFILKNEKYGGSRIKVDITPSTTWENIRNKMLCLVPHGLAMIIPDLVQRQIDGVYNSVGGIAICAAGSFLFGELVYPRVDLYNSNVCKFSQWYGPNNHKKIRVGREFVCLSVISSLVGLAAQKFLSWQAIPWKILGGGVHVIRALLSGIVLINIENFYNENPYKRLNEKGVPFMLKDLANGPKFTK